MKIQSIGLQIIKEFEFLKLKLCLCQAGTTTIGYGSTCLRSPDEVEFYYLVLPPSTALARCALIDS